MSVYSSRSLLNKVRLRLCASLFGLAWRLSMDRTMFLRGLGRTRQKGTDGSESGIRISSFSFSLSDTGA